MPSNELNISTRDEPDLPGKYNLTNPAQPISVGKAGLKKFEEFAQTTFTWLVKLREAKIGRRSELRTFARLDISVMRSPEGQAQFMVNEVEITFGTNLFLHSARHRAETIGATLADYFYRKAMTRCPEDII